MHLGLMLECEYRPDTGDAQAFSDAFRFKKKEGP